jgi:DNA-binding NarL/FixJ family response regulator
MTDKLIATILDYQTGEITERELTADEISTREVLANDLEAQELAREAKLLARQSALAKLTALGLTEEEIGAL